MTLHLTQAKRNSLREFKSTSRLFDDAIVFLKMMSTLEGCEYLVSCNNHCFKEVGRRKKRKVKMSRVECPYTLHYEFQNRDLDQVLTTVNTMTMQY